MPRITILLILLVTSCLTGRTQMATTTEPHPLTLADPTLFFHEGKYYAYGTAGMGSGNGIPVFVSDDLKQWKAIPTNDGFALKKGDAFGTKGFWAPQVFYLNGLYYMAYTANENIALATSNQPYGPFSSLNKTALPAPVKQIDPFVFMDEDGKKYLYHVRLKDGNRIYGAVLKDDLSGIDESSLRECISATEKWENTGDSAWPVTEGPSVVKRNGKYYMFYSANDFRNPDYAVGIATSDHPLGPWKKEKNNPLLSRKETGLNGTGHGDLFQTPTGDLYYIFHVHQSATKVAPRKTMLIKVTFKNKHFEFDKNSVTPVNTN